MKRIVKIISNKMSGDLLTDHVRPAQNGPHFPTNRNRFLNFFRRKTLMQVLAGAGRDEIDNNTYSDFMQTEFKPRYVMNDIFHREDERLKTFESWPLEWLDKNQLAMTGMFYMGEGDKTKCYFCEVEIGYWERQDQPVSEHLRFSPNCPLLRRRTTNNVPINSEALERLLPAPSYDICGLNEHIEVRRNAFPEGTIPAVDIPPASPTVGVSGNNSISNGGNSNNSGTFYPEFPEYAIETARLRSFAEWPRNMKQKPAQLAEVGFFYTGIGDRVRCFSCGGGLKDWEEDDDPWEQHALWMRKCRYLKLMKGDAFIESVVNKLNKSTTSNSSEEGELQTVAVASAITTAASSTTTTTPHTITATVTSTAIATPSTQATTATTNSTVSENQALLPTSCATQTLSETQQNTKLIPSSCSIEQKKWSLIPEEKLCKICYVDEYNTAFLPCGHVVACAKCASSVTKCPLCRKPFADVMRVYFS